MSQVRADPKPRDGTVGEVRCHRFAWLGDPPGKMVFFRKCSWEEHGNSRVSSWGFQGEHGKSTGNEALNIFLAGNIMEIPREMDVAGV